MKKYILIASTMLAILISFVPAYSPPSKTDHDVFIDSQHAVNSGADSSLLEDEKAKYELIFNTDTTTLAENRISGLKTGFVNLCVALCPLSMLVFIALLFFARNEKNIGLYLKILGTIFLTTLIVLLIEKNTIASIVDQIVDVFNVGY